MVYNRVARRPAGSVATPLSEGMDLWKPTIAAVNGYAIAGGFTLAMRCDIRIMAEDARVGISEVRWNMGGAGWMTPLTRQIGLGSALELILWGDIQYGAERCYQLGWAQRVVPREQLMETAMDYAQRALDMAPRAVRNMKQALYRGFYMDPLSGQAYGSALEQNLGGMQDSIEGPLAFSEKRRPNFIDARPAGPRAPPRRVTSGSRAASSTPPARGRRAAGGAARTTPPSTRPPAPRPWG